MSDKIINLETSIKNLETALENVWWKHQSQPDEKDFDKFFNLCESLTKDIKQDFELFEKEINDE